MKKLLIAAAVLAGLGIVVVPSLLRARVTSGESPIIGDTRTVISAMSAYQGVNHGYSDAYLECLGRPSQCLPGYGPDQPTFLDPALAQSQLTKSGYERRFIAGPRALPAEIEKVEASPSSVQCYAYVAVPIAELRERGARSYCGDCSGRVCFYPDGQPAPISPEGMCGSRGADGKVTSSCTALQ